MHLMLSRGVAYGILFTGVLIGLFLTHCSQNPPLVTCPHERVHLLS